MRQKILLTGAGGFLGINLLREGLLHKEYEFWAVSSNPDKIKSLVNDENIVVVPREWPFTAEFPKENFSCVINCAFPRNTDGFEVAQGLDYLEELFKAFKNDHVDSIINISSQSVYDDQRTELATEESPVCLKTPYAVGKYMTEKLLDAICSDIPHTNIRMASLIGPGFDQRIVNRFVKSALEQHIINLNINNKKFGFLDINDAVKGIFSLLTVEAGSWKAVYNLGNNRAYSLADMVNVVIEVFQDNHLQVPQLIVTEDNGTGMTGVNSESLQRDTGYQAQVDLHESVNRILMKMIN